MSVIVKNMEMPENCAECKMWSICECLNDFEDFESICYAVEDGDLVRDKNCPLIEARESLFSAKNAGKFLMENPPKEGETE